MTHAHSDRPRRRATILLLKVMWIKEEEVFTLLHVLISQRGIKRCDNESKAAKE
jgi:hypothetical protein